MPIVIIFLCRFVFARISDFGLIIEKLLRRTNWTFKQAYYPSYKKAPVSIKYSHRIIDLFQCSIFISICARFPPSYVLNTASDKDINRFDYSFDYSAKTVDKKPCIYGISAILWEFKSLLPHQALILGNQRSRLFVFSISPCCVIRRRFSLQNTLPDTPRSRLIWRLAFFIQSAIIVYMEA